MKMLLIDTRLVMPVILDVDGTLEEYYRLLQCDTIDIVCRQIGGKYFNVICDDEGLFKSDNVVTGIDADGEPCLVGNLLFCNAGKDGYEKGLSDEDITRISKNLVVLSAKDQSRRWLAINGLAY